MSPAPAPHTSPQVVTIVTGAGGFQVSENPSSTAWSRGPPSTARGGRLPRRRRQESLGSGVVVVPWTHSPPLLPGERWQLANTALYFSPKHPFQVVPGCKNVCSISIPPKCKYFQKLTFFTSSRGENYHFIKERGRSYFVVVTHVECRF